MEPRQIAHITRNWAKLQNYTFANACLMAVLQVDMLSEEEVQLVQAEQTQLKQASKLYSFMITKKDGYMALLSALKETQQSGAYNILLSVSSEMIKNLRVGMTHTVGDLLSSDQIADIETWVNERDREDMREKLHKTIFSSKEEINLWCDNIPEPHTPYIPRDLSRRAVVDPKMFKNSINSISDVFVFKDIKKERRDELRSYVNCRFGIESSTKELLKTEIKARFILLDDDAHWTDICKRVQSPVHLIRFENATTPSFIVEDTCGFSTALRQHLKNKDKNPEIISEDAFVEKIITGCEKGVCICDVPGMGKSLLLANIARKIHTYPKHQQTCPNRLVAFIQLRDLVLSAGQLSEDAIISAILKIICPSEFKFHIHILKQIIKTNKDIKFELFCDGLDEVKEIKQTISFLCKIYEIFPRARLYVTSRPLVREKLEESISVIAYDIVGFSDETQKQCVVSYWLNKLSNDQMDKKQIEKLNKIASACLQSFKSNLKTHVRDIAGKPLQCKLLAEVYFEKAIIYATSPYDVPLEQNFNNSLCVIYSKFMLRQLGKRECNFECMYKQQAISCSIDCQVRSFHVWKSIQVIFPELGIYMSNKIRNFHGLNETNKLSPGLLEKRNNADSADVQFVHRTFAEYLVAEYLTSVVFANIEFPQQQIPFQQFVFNLVFKSRERVPFQYVGFTYRLRIKEQVVAYFLNSLLAQNKTNAINILCKADMSDCREFLRTICACMFEDSSPLLDVYLKAVENTWEKATGEQKEDFERFLQNLKTDYDKNLQGILTTAASICNVETVQKICNLCKKIFNLNLLHLHYPYFFAEPIQIAILRGDHELTTFFADEMSLERTIKYCVEHTYFECDDVVNKRLDIAKVLLEKDPTLLTDPEHFRTYGHPILANLMHLNAIRFLIRNGAEYLKTQYFQHHLIRNASQYMSDEHFKELCNFLDAQYNNEMNFLLEPQRLEKYLFNGPSWCKDKTKLLINLLQCFNTIANNGSNSSKHEENQCPEEVINRFLMNMQSCKKNKKMFPILLHAAVCEGFAGIVERLLRSDRNTFRQNVMMQREGATVPLLFAAGSGEVFSLLVSHKASIFDVDSKGRTVLHFLLERPNQRYVIFCEVLKFLGTLSNYGVPIFTRFAIGNIFFNVVEMLRIFISKMFWTDTTKPNNFLELFNWPTTYSLKTPLHCYLQNLKSDPNTLDLFLKGGRTSASDIVVNVNAIDAEGNSALHYCLRRDIKFTMCLKSHGLDITVKTRDGCNVTHICARKDRLEHLNYFLELGIDVNEVDLKGNNALQCALAHVSEENWIQHMSLETFQVLYDATVDKRHVNFENKTAYDIAKEKQVEMQSWKENYLTEDYNNYLINKKADWNFILTQLKVDIDMKQAENI